MIVTIVCLVNGLRHFSSQLCVCVCVCYFTQRMSLDKESVDDRSQIYVRHDEPIKVHSARSALVVTRRSTNRGRYA